MTGGWDMLALLVISVAIVIFTLEKEWRACVLLIAFLLGALLAQFVRWINVSLLVRYSYLMAIFIVALLFLCSLSFWVEEALGGGKPK
jgi:hypothetical protein